MRPKIVALSTGGDREDDHRQDRLQGGSAQRRIRRIDGSRIGSRCIRLHPRNPWPIVLPELTRSRVRRVKSVKTLALPPADIPRHPCQIDHQPFELRSVIRGRHQRLARPQLVDLRLERRAPL